jgi:hypothetical protein
MRVLNPGSLPSGSKNPSAVPGEPNTFNYVDMAAFGSLVGTYTNPLTGKSSIGPFPSNMTARDAFRGPGNWNLDLSLAKRFQLTDKVNLQLRCEAYDVFNHANLYVDGATIRANSNDFVRAYRTDHRNVQVAARLSF